MMTDFPRITQQISRSRPIMHGLHYRYSSNGGKINEQSISIDHYAVVWLCTSPYEELELMQAFVLPPPFIQAGRYFTLSFYQNAGRRALS